jgi:GT2 family glycosyltransferase
MEQNWERISVVVVDNSGEGRARTRLQAWPGVHILENPENAGFGAAVNRGFREFPADFLATMNDDATASPDWIRHLVEALESDPAAGMAASKVILAGTDRLDSAGMSIARDGSSRQRGHGEPERFHNTPCEVLLPSGSAAMYRREMLEQTGLFEEDFFLYCEDTDLGLRGRWAGWKCLYAPEARVLHRWSGTGSGWWCEIFLLQWQSPVFCGPLRGTSGMEWTSSSATERRRNSGAAREAHGSCRGLS